MLGSYLLHAMCYLCDRSFRFMYTEVLDIYPAETGLLCCVDLHTLKKRMHAILSSSGGPAVLPRRTAELAPLRHRNVGSAGIEEQLHLGGAETASAAGLGRCAEGYLEDVEGLAQVVHVPGFGSLTFHGDEGGQIGYAAVGAAEGVVVGVGGVLVVVDVVEWDEVAVQYGLVVVVLGADQSRGTLAGVWLFRPHPFSSVLEDVATAGLSTKEGATTTHRTESSRRVCLAAGCHCHCGVCWL